MTLEKLKSIHAHFKNQGELISFSQLASGHINDTFLIETSQNDWFILQQINHTVFKDVLGLVNNKILISKHLQNKLSSLPFDELKRRVLSFVETVNGNYCYLDEDGNYWNMMFYINDSVTYETVNCEDVAYEAGKLVGNFLNLTSDFDISQLIEVIPKFHDMTFRFSQFEDSLKVASDSRLKEAKKYIDLVRSLKSEMHLIQNLKESGKIKTRVTHNDTKISNVLFDTNKKGLCVIDTDTIMPGIVHYDFGDAIRTICNTAAEDENDLDKVTFNMAYYKSYVKGFLEEVETSLTPLDIKYLPLAAKTMIFIMAIRFLTDFLNGDIYYKTAYPKHNLDRAKNQFKLINSLTEQFKEMEIFSTIIK